MGKFIDISGQRFGMLTVTKRVENDQRNNVMWQCSCDCGGSKITRGTHLRHGYTKSCGCMKSEWISQAQTKHGLSDVNHPEYKRYEFERRLPRKYGITADDYYQMLDEQSNKCAICEVKFDDDVKPHVDHCHNTGNVRGLLCRACNTAIGMFRDDTDALKSAIKYLEKQ